MVSIKDVASHAGVSDKTVSRVVNGEASVKPATQKRVQASIDALGYVPNQAARMMRSNRSRVIGVMTDVVATTPNSVELIGGMQDRLSAAGLVVLIANTGGTEEGERRVWRTFQEHRIEGVLYATMYHRHVQLAVNPPPLPAVLVNCSSPLSPDIPSVVPDDFQGGYVAAQHALATGHTRIGYITLNPRIVAAKLRIGGFRQALQEAGVEVLEDCIRAGYEGPVDGDTMCAYDVALDMLGGAADARPTVVLCGNDEIALQVVCAARTLGLRLPQDLAVVGFDDFRMISTRVVPQLTTMALPYYKIGERAADKLLRMLEGEALAVFADKLYCPLVRRDSA